jgi:RNA-directed DNA polymerase
MEIDHIITRSQGGRKIAGNIQLMHRHCHDKKTAEDANSNSIDK